MTTPDTTQANALGWRDLGPLPTLLSGGDPQVRAAATEAVARLPLSQQAWERVGDLLTETLDQSDPGLPLVPVARAAAHVPVAGVRRRLRRVAQDGSHPGQHAATVVLTEVGDDSVLSVEVDRLLRQRLTGSAARRLACLPLERLHLSPTQLPDVRADTSDASAQSWWLAVAAARVGDPDPLDRWLSRLRSDQESLPSDVSTLSSVLPLPDHVVDHVAQRLSPGAPAHDALRSAWLTQEPAPARHTELASLIERLAPRLRDESTALNACLTIRDAAARRPWWPPVELIEATDEGSESVDWAEGDVSFELPGSEPLPSFPGPVTARPSTGATPEPSPGYARMTCPSAVVVEQEFELEIGLAERPTPGVTAQPLTLPERTDYGLTVQVVFDGFRLRADEQPTLSLAVGPDTPYPTTTLHLTAVDDSGLGPVRAILAVFSVDGLAVGSATRAVSVVPTPDDMPSDADKAPATGVDTAVPADAQAADLTITISLGDDVERHRLLWSYQSPHRAVPPQAEPLACSLGSRPDEFARSLMRTAGRLEGEALGRLVIGKAKRIAEAVPPPILAALHAAAAAVGGPPSVLLLSADPFVPWELARVESPWLPDAPAVLGAQARVGRWALRSSGPTSEPPREVSMRAMAVVRGEYDVQRLEHAEQEAEDLRTTYGAAVVDAAEHPFFACLDGEPPADVLHFAMHGKFDPGGLQDGLILVDGAVVEPDMILGSDLARHPFVFLNACQVGQAGETLGQYGGMAQAFVEAGAAAVIAPLWVVQDDVARDVSLRFYAAAFAGTSPGEFLRTERTRNGSGTHLAYVLYGHPLMQLTRSH
jgi:hypothetical protein